jgi:hypothetical protein
LLLSSMYHCASLCCCRPGEYYSTSHSLSVLVSFLKSFIVRRI